MSILPEDLVEEILSRVPATSLKRLRYTCKQWNALFNDHQFIKKHVDKAPKESRVIMLANSRVYSMSVNLRGIQNNIDPSVELKGELGPLDDMLRIFHCNGLLLCIKDTMDCKGIAVVYNPCTGQTRSIKLTTVDEYSDKFALGYENNKSCFESYKILRFRLRTSGFDAEFEIYEFKLNSWRVLDDIPHDPTYFETKDRGVSLMGNTYWITFDGFLSQFDFTKERFQRFYLPFECNFHDIVELSTVREEKLAVLFQKRFGSTTMEVWLTNKIDPLNDLITLRMFFKVDLKDTYMHPYSMSFVLDEENRVALCCARDASYIFSKTYIIGEDKLRQVDFLGKSAIQTIPSEPLLLSYVPSLIQIEEPKET
ncbi:unnamed protein product [Microthlaspi erraticum]|uniref:F-box domain-containing protein n=1 Tax=Microthlaspi erraticum TaxID=1685480 RepID=A0A6D2KN32_9BRAS|nr:unnamed protein product [Microthlaspi erraticum]